LPDYNPNAPPNISDTDGTVLFNGLRGNSIARSMYGRDVFAHYDALNKLYNASAFSQALTTPWAGVGTFHMPTAVPGLDRAQVVNYTLVNVGGNYYLFDPEYTGPRAVAANGTPAPFDPTTNTYVNKAAGYT